MHNGLALSARSGARSLPHVTALCLVLMLSVPPRAANSQTTPVEPPPVGTPTESSAQPAPSDTATLAPAPTAVAAPAPAAPAPAPADADSVPDPDGGWPRLIAAPSGADIVLYQPQVLSWEGQKHIVAMCAVSYMPKGAQKPELGTIRFESPTSTSVEDRMVNLQKLQITSMRFASLQKAQTQEVLTEITKSFPQENLLVSLDRIIAMADTSLISAKGVAINTVPPPIYFSKKPAILVQFNGEPIMAPVEGSLKYVVNTNWDVFRDEDAKLYFLLNETYWLMSPDLKKWEPVKELPPSFEKLAKDDNWASVRANIPPKKMKGKMPVVFVSTTPSELILVDGSPKYEKIEGTDLSWVENTETDVFKMNKGDKLHYVLLSGRWFSTKKLDKGPWEFATTKLPPDFAKIPRSHDRARVLSSVPGTEEAAEAILLAQVPKTARVDAKALKAPDVKYDGDPKFKEIAGTKGVSYAENTGYDVLLVGGAYYLCYQAVWFTSQSPTGPWVVTASVPAEIYNIPSNSPAHHVTYVTVVDDDPDYPTYGYTSGYVGITIAFGCAMWGTGWYYPPYYHYPGYGMPIYYPRPVAYGGGAVYNPWTGAYGHYQTAYGPYGGVARGAAYNPNTGTYARGAMAWGPTGAQGYASAYNPRTGTYASTRQGSNIYGSWGSSSVQRGDDWVNTQRVTDAQGNTKWKAQGSGGGSAAGIRTDQGGGFVGKKGDDIYAGHDGNVYKKTDGGWQKYEQGGGWSDVSRPEGGARPGQQPSTGAGERPSQQPSTGAGQPSQRPSAGQQPSGGQSPSAGQLDREARARSEGQQRTRDYGNYQRSGGSSRGGSYGGSRGGSRGGGGRGGGGRRR